MCSSLFDVHVVITLHFHRQSGVLPPTSAAVVRDIIPEEEGSDEASDRIESEVREQRHLYYACTCMYLYRTKFAFITFILYLQF